MDWWCRLIKPVCPNCHSVDLEIVTQRFVEHGAKSPNEEPLRDEAVTIEYRCPKCGHTFDHLARKGP